MHSVENPPNGLSKSPLAKNGKEGSRDKKMHVSNVIFPEHASFLTHLSSQLDSVAPSSPPWPQSLTTSWAGQLRNRSPGCFKTTHRDASNPVCFKMTLSDSGFPHFPPPRKSRPQKSRLSKNNLLKRVCTWLKTPPTAYQNQTWAKMRKKGREIKRCMFPMSSFTPALTWAGRPVCRTWVV